jgi:dienelactone hydrolase
MNMNRFYSSIAIISGLFLSAACTSDDAESNVVRESHSLVTTVLSRGVEIPVTYTAPFADADETFPLVVMAHGHGGSRQEGGGYVAFAQRLAELGIASIRMDFPGCGDSSESFVENNLSNMLLDLQASREFAETQQGVDASRVGLLGYSMGGRLASLLSQIDPSYKAMALWAPAVADGSVRENESFGGGEVYAAMRKEAEESGSVDYTTQWGQDLTLGLRWFTDIENSKPLDALAVYEGPLLVLYGDADSVVPPAIPESGISAAVKSAEVVRHVMPGIGHGLGIYSGLEDVSAEVINTSAEFLQQRL